jgi:hypothetical protein
MSMTAKNRCPLFRAMPTLLTEHRFFRKTGAPFWHDTLETEAFAMRPAALVFAPLCVGMMALAPHAEAKSCPPGTVADPATNNRCVAASTRARYDKGQQPLKDQQAQQEPQAQPAAVGGGY